MHRSRGTIDPSDLSSVAYELLLACPKTLHVIRSKLQHVIIDEYQDLSVSQHRLVSLILKGEPKMITNMEKTNAPSILLDDLSFSVSKHAHISQDILFTTPKLFAAGDPYQSIYGWRAASPVTTVEGFRHDYPQGVVIPLKTHFRSPQAILSTAQSLFKASPFQPHMGSLTTSGMDVSPAATQSFQGMLKWNNSSSVFRDEMVTKLIDKYSSGRITIKGLWDEREESKYILSRIRKRWRERADCFSNVSRSTRGTFGTTFYDQSDVAIMARTSSQLGVLMEELRKSNIPYTCDQYDTKSIVSAIGQRMLPTKPVRVISMHRAKGDEFDDVYLLGWNEGIFPHPTSVTSSRVEEERRLAYVALSRARQRCFITYSFVHRHAYMGPR
jgi:superfamily I DNA/RNA helicase